MDKNKVAKVIRFTPDVLDDFQTMKAKLKEKGISLSDSKLVEYMIAKCKHTIDKEL